MQFAEIFIRGPVLSSMVSLGLVLPGVIGVVVGGLERMMEAMAVAGQPRAVRTQAVQ